MHETSRKEVTENVVFMTPKQATERYGLCRNTVVQLARTANCLYRFGKSARIKVAPMDEYMETHKCL